MIDLSAPPPGPTLAPALRRLAALRARQRLLRAAFWIWSIVTLLWLLPLGAWSATALPMTAALTIGGVLVLCGAALVLLHNAANRLDAVRHMLAGDTPRSHGHDAARAEVRPSPQDETIPARLREGVDLVTVLHADGGCRAVTASVARILGYQPGELLGGDFFALVHTEDTARVLRVHLDCLTAPSGSGSTEFRYRDRGGAWRSLQSTFTNLLADPEVRGVVVRSHDVTERRRAETAATDQLQHDALTGLPNRVLFSERLTRVLRGPSSPWQPAAVMLVDVSRFRVIVESLGHGAGEALLREVSRRLLSCVRPGDVVGRLGGDTFAILMEGVAGAEEPRRAAERFNATTTHPFRVEARDLFAAVCTGIALTVECDVSPEDVQRRAQAALSRAKSLGAGCMVVYDPSMSLSIERLDLETDLRLAVGRGELRLDYQPMVELAGGAVTGVEALLRWQHPRRGLLSPAVIIPLAEDTGLIEPVGTWVLREACRQARLWERAYRTTKPLLMSVNLSVRQLRQPDFVEQVARILDETEMAPSGLQLEITESAAMRDLEGTVATLHALKRLGVRLAIDDFGTGYSSLSYLRRFPVDTLKIDRSFVSGVAGEREIGAIARAVTTLAHDFGLLVIAEGIETAGQLARLRAAGCDQGQGYFFAPPLSSDAAGEALLQTLPR